MSKFRDGLIGPTVILLAICAVITFALAGVYNVTKPVIEQGEIEAANLARAKVLSTGDSFTQLDVELPDGVSEAFIADNGTGYVFKSAAKGYGGDVVYMIGIDAGGNVAGIEIFDHGETPGLGTKIFDAGYSGQYLGDVDPDSVDAVSGATRTSNSLKNSIKQAKEAYQTLKGA